MPASGPEPSQPNRFPKSIRIRSRRDYVRVQKHGARAPSKQCLVLYREGRESHARFGITVSKKVGNAVTRNRVKRMLREAIRHHHHVVKAPLDVVFIASPRAARASASELAGDVAAAMAFLSSRVR